MKPDSGFHKREKWGRESGAFIWELLLAAAVSFEIKHEGNGRTGEREIPAPSFEEHHKKGD